ncbi:MAG: transglutaminase TgpA family protein [Acidimicrobiales bacterium]
MSRRGHMLLAAEVALALVTLAAVTGMHRLFIDGSYRGSLALQAIAAHVVVATLRRRRLPLLPAAAVTGVAAVLFITWTRFGDTVGYLLPTGATLGAAGDDLDAAWRVFQEVKAPAPVVNGFIVATAIAIWLLAFVADWAAFRARAAFEALLPATTLFLFAAALGAPGGRVASAAVFAAAALLFVLLHRTFIQEESSTWAASHRERGRWSLLGTGAALTTVAVVAGAVTGPRLPGAEAEAVIDWRHIGDDEPTRVVPSPMVDLRTRLVEQPEAQVFTVRSEEPSYWRLTALDEFDGQIWKSSYGTDGADGELPRAVDSAVETDSVRQTVTVDALGGVWLPAAFEPRSLDAGDAHVGWDEDSSTLIVDRDVPTSDGLTYEVTSAIPKWRGAQLREVSDADLPEEFGRQYTALPEAVSPEVRGLAQTIVGRAGAATPYDRAMALQSYLRNRFTYDTTVGPGAGADALASFLFQTRRGYCEQFAGSFAVLARAVNLPTRVAVGFSWGARDPEEPTLYRVRGVHAHAWPEVYFHGYGWVQFEPTPGRAPVNGDQWLGLPAEGRQDASDGAASITAGGTGDPNAGTEGGDLSAGDEQRLNAGLAEAGPSGESGQTGDSGLPEGVRNVGIAIALAIAAYLVLVPLAIAGRRFVRRRRARSAADKVRLSWREATERAEAAGVRLPASLTIAEAADRLTAAVPRSAEAVQHVARTMERIAYAEVAPTPDDVANAQHAWTSVKAEINQWEPRWPRVFRYFDVRQLRRRDRRTRLVTQHHAVVAAGR